MSIYRIISAERASFPVSVMCEVLGVSRSGFHGWERRAPSDRALERCVADLEDQGDPRATPEASTARGVCRPSCASARASTSRASACAG